MTSIQHLNPAGLHRNPAFSQAVVISNPEKLIYIGGQNAVDTEGNIVGKGDIRAQCAQVARNLETALAAAGATPRDIVKWTVYVVQGQPAYAGFEAFREAWGDFENPPAISVIYVAGLAHPDFLVEIDAVAATN